MEEGDLPESATETKIRKTIGQSSGGEWTGTLRIQRQRQVRTAPTLIGFPGGIITMSNESIFHCFALEHLEMERSELFGRISESWIMFDPFNLLSAPDLEESSSKTYIFDGDLSFVDRDYDWFGSVVFFDAVSFDQDELEKLTITKANTLPDWAAKFDFFMTNHEKFGKVSDNVLIPGMWHVDHLHGNHVMFCRDVRVLESFVGEITFEPIVPAAVLRVWPREMLRYIRSGVGITGVEL